MEKEVKKIYVIGHKNPDTDSVCSAIAYAYYLRKKGKKAIAARAGEINLETKYVLNHFGIDTPEILADAAGKEMILLDHNEKSQSINNIELAKIIEVIDHHKIDFEIAEPIYFSTEPVGATATLVARKILNDKKVKMTKKIAGILLSAVLSDTVVFRSPTTTKEDINIAKKLAKIAKIKNLEKFGIEIKKQKATLKGLDAKTIIYSDFKDFDFAGKKIGIGQVELCDLKEAGERKKELVEKMKEIAENEKYNLILLMLTDIIKKGSEILAWGEINYAEKAFGEKVENDSFYLKDVMSRKKEVVPPLTKIFSDSCH